MTKMTKNDDFSVFDGISKLLVFFGLHGFKMG